jgi:hypothetical protein
MVIKNEIGKVEKGSSKKFLTLMSPDAKIIL